MFQYNIMSVTCWNYDVLFLAFKFIAVHEMAWICLGGSIRLQSLRRHASLYYCVIFILWTRDPNLHHMPHLCKQILLEHNYNIICELSFFEGWPKNCLLPCSEAPILFKGAHHKTLLIFFNFPHFISKSRSSLHCWCCCATQNAAL